MSQARKVTTAARQERKTTTDAAAPRSLKVILGSTREGRFGDKPAHWILGEASRQPGVAAELLDLPV